MPPPASERTESAVPAPASEANAEEAGALAPDEEGDVGDTEAAADSGVGEERQSVSADENDAADVVHPNISEVSRPMTVETNDKRPRECTPELASPSRRSVRARQTPRRLLHI